MAKVYQDCGLSNPCVTRDGGADLPLPKIEIQQYRW
jgi:hypothetical protein